MHRRRPPESDYLASNLLLCLAIHVPLMLASSYLVQSGNNNSSLPYPVDLMLTHMNYLG